MTAAETQSVVVERDVPWPPEKVWRALTTAHLVEEWLMKNDFQAKVGHAFQFQADWGTVDCEVLTLEPYSALSYSWTVFGGRTVVSWTLTPTPTGTHVRVEQAGFSTGAESKRFVAGALQGWSCFLSRLEQVLEADF